MIPQALEIQQTILQKEMNSVEDNLNVLRREGKGISRGMLKGLEKRKYPSLEQEHSRALISDAPQVRGWRRRLISIEQSLISTPIDLSLRHG
jgi:superfamily II DNA and RNA helicase